MDKTFRILYRLYGSIDVPAKSKEDAEDILGGLIVEGSNGVTDADLINGIGRTRFPGNPAFNIDGDAIEIVEVEELE